MSDDVFEMEVDTIQGVDYSDLRPQALVIQTPLVLRLAKDVRNFFNPAVVRCC
ncbi:hypothetical protein D3C80_2039800 [compost metagenome]